MEFKTKLSNVFVMNMIMIILALCMSAFSFFYTGFRYPIFHYSCILWLVIAFIRLKAYIKYIQLRFYQKPVLIVNENYIYDLAKEIKYYWKDIKEIYDDNGYLYINLYEPEDYLNNIKGPFNRFMAGFRKTPFTINVDMVYVNQSVLLDILDDYSIEAIANETK